MPAASRQLSTPVKEVPSLETFLIPVQVHEALLQRAALRVRGVGLEHTLAATPCSRTATDGAYPSSSRIEVREANGEPVAVRMVDGPAREMDPPTL